MVRTSKQYSKDLNPEVLRELEKIALKVGKLKQYVYSRYGSLNGLLFLHGYALRNDLRDGKINIKQNMFGLNSAYFQTAVAEATIIINNSWESAKKVLRGKLKQFTDKEVHYIMTVLKINKDLFEVLHNRPAECAIRFKGVNTEKLDHFIARNLRKTHCKPIQHKHRSFSLTSVTYRYIKGGIKVASLTPKERIFIPLTDKTIRTGNIKIVIQESGQVEIHSTSSVKTKTNLSEMIIGIDKGFNLMIVTSTGNIYGSEFGVLLKKYSDFLNDRGKNQNKLRELANKYEQTGKIEKAKNIRNVNLSDKKNRKKIDSYRSRIQNYVNREVKRFFETEQPKKIGEEALNFCHKTRLPDKNTRRYVNTWTKGYLTERIAFYANKYGVEVQKVNPAFTSRTCSSCGLLGKKPKGDTFNCKNCGGINAHFNASLNILKRIDENTHDMENHIASSILSSRALESSKVLETNNKSVGQKENTVLSKNRDTGDQSIRLRNSTTGEVA